MVYFFRDPRVVSLFCNCDSPVFKSNPENQNLYPTLNYFVVNTLHALTDRLAGSFLPAAVQNHNFFVNDIPDDLAVEYNKEWLCSVISGMLAEVVRQAKNTCIRLSARKYGYIIVLEIQQGGHPAAYAKSNTIGQLQVLAEKIGGCLHVTSARPRTNLLSFSFPNLPALS